MYKLYMECITCKWNPSKGVLHLSEGCTLHLCITREWNPSKRVWLSLRKRYTIFMHTVTCKWNP